MVTKDTMDNSSESGYDKEKETKGDENMVNAHATSPVTPLAEEWVTTGDAAKILQVGLTTVKRWVKTGRLEGRRLGGEGGWIQISVASIMTLLNTADEDIIRMQILEKSLEETKDLDAELTEELLDDLSMSKLGKLPWQV